MITKHFTKKHNELNLSLYNLVFLFTTLIFLLSLFWFDFIFSNLLTYSSIVILLLGYVLGKRYSAITLIIGILILLYTVYLNYNYFLIFATFIVSSLLLVHLINHKLRIPHYTYTLIPIFIFFHMIWITILPFGYSGEWEINVGGLDDMSQRNSLYINDVNTVLGPIQVFGSQSWREFTEDGYFLVELNTPIIIGNKSVEVILNYDAKGPIFINSELFYDPKWGSYVNLGTYDENFIYGDSSLDISIPYKNTPLNVFLNLTGSSSLQEYLYVNIGYDKGILEYLSEINVSQQELIDYELNTGNYPKRTSIGTDFDKLEDFLLDRYPEGVSIEDFTGQYKDLELELNQRYVQKINSLANYPDFSDNIFKFDSSLRGDSTFVGFFKDEISFSFEKQDLNWNDGLDDVSINIYDYNNVIIDTIFIKDIDNISTRTFNESEFVEFSVIKKIDSQGIYKIEVSHATFNKDPDYIIRDISFNSNKVSLFGDALIWDSARLYITDQSETLEFRFWWEGYDQEIIFNNIQSFSLENRGFWYNKSLSNTNSIDINLGKLAFRGVNQLGLFSNTYIDIDKNSILKITKSKDFTKENIKLTSLDKLNISSTIGTKIYSITLQKDIS